MIDADTLQRQASNLKRVEAAATPTITTSQATNGPLESDLTSVLQSAFAKIYEKANLDNDDNNLTWEEEEEKADASEIIEAAPTLSLTEKLAHVLKTHKEFYPELYNYDSDSVSDWDETPVEPIAQKVAAKSPVRRLPSTPSVLNIAELALKQSLEAKEPKSQREEDYDNLYKALFGDEVISIEQREDFEIFFEDAFGKEDLDASKTMQAEENKEFVRLLFWKIDSNLTLDEARKKHAEFQREAIRQANEFHKTNCETVKDIYLQFVPMIKEKQKEKHIAINKALSNFFDEHYGEKMPMQTKRDHLKLGKAMFDSVPSRFDITVFNFFFDNASYNQEINANKQLTHSMLKAKFQQYLSYYNALIKYYAKYVNDKTQGDDAAKMLHYILMRPFESREHFISIYHAIFGTELPNDERMKDFNEFFADFNETDNVSKARIIYDLFVSIDDSMTKDLRESEQKERFGLIEYFEGVKCESFRDMYEKIILPKWRELQNEKLKANTSNTLPAFKLAQENKENKSVANTNNHNAERASLKRSI